MQIRKCTPQDAEALARIYAPYVEHTAISFEIVAPTVEEFRQRIERISAKYPYLVAVEENAENEDILGYAYASAFHPRAALSHCAEASIYLAQNQCGKGVGTALYDKLECLLRAQGIKNMYASIAWTDTPDEYLNNGSTAFHHARGFSKVAHFHHCGYKFERYYDLIWMEKFLR